MRKTLMPSLHHFVIAVSAVSVVGVIQALVPEFPAKLLTDSRGLARVMVTQTFTNQSDKWVNGLYVFPLPHNAAVDHLMVQIDEGLCDRVALFGRACRAN